MITLTNRQGQPQQFNSWADVYAAYQQSPGAFEYMTYNGQPFTNLVPNLPNMAQQSQSSGTSTTTAPSPSTTFTPGTSSQPIAEGTAPTQSGLSGLIPGASQQQQDILNQYIQQSQGNTTSGINQAGALGQQDLAQLQPLMNQFIQQQESSLTDPNSPQYQQLMGALNNSGVASGGEFSGALAGQLAPLVSQNEMTLAGDTLLPGFANQQDILNQGTQGTGSLIGNEAGVQSNLGLDPLQENQQEYWWNQQANLANQLAAQGASTQLGSGLGDLIGGGLGAGIGGFAGGPTGALIGSQIGSKGGSAAGAGTWICTEMRERGILTRNEVDILHHHLYRAFWSKPFKFMGYILFGRLLVFLANKTHTDWNIWKTEFYDDILAETNPVKAVELYEETFWKLYKNVRRNLEERRQYAI